MILSIAVAGVLAVTAWFTIPFSPVKKRFEKESSGLIRDKRMNFETSFFSEEEFADFPVTLRRYLAHCGYFGKEKTSAVKLTYRKVTFLRGKNGPHLKINYTQVNTAEEPNRLAMIDSRMFGIPFEGYDYYLEGRGGMRGVLAKGICLFEETGEQMDDACLVTWLAECLFLPSSWLTGRIVFEEAGPFRVKAEVSFQGRKVNGIFVFNDQYEMTEFHTECRYLTDSDGFMRKTPWSALCGEYHTNRYGILVPGVFRAVWNEREGDFVYFDGRIDEITCFF